MGGISIFNTKEHPMSEAYSDHHIQTLSPMEHIRKRMGMYIGRGNDGSDYDDGIYILLKEIIDNSIDEYTMGFGKRIDIQLNYETGKVTVRDYGRGIPLGKVVACVSTMNTGGKFSDESFQFSVGMNGVGTKAVNALSKAFEVRSYRDNETVEALFEKGILISTKKSRSPTHIPDGTSICFTPDESIFTNYKFLPQHVERRLKMYAYLNAGLVLDLDGKQFSAKNGVLDLINEESQREKVYTPLYHRSKTMELVFTHTNRSTEEYFSFANGQFTSDGGTHLSAFKEGFLKAVNEFSKEKFDGDVAREGIVAAVAIRIQNPMFEAQTKNKLGNAELRAEWVTEIKRIVEELLHRNPVDADKLIAKIKESQKIRETLTAVKKLARERSESTSVHVPQLKDCKEHLNNKKETGLETMIFITEGKSASGTITSVRNVNTQAVFTLRGKFQNVYGRKRDILYENELLYNLMRCLGIEHSSDGLRYQKIIIATDADVDGLHIRNLMLTLFLSFFKEVVLRGHLFILETPLFRVRTKRENRYCYSEEERLKAMEELGAHAEITRFKGLGEINADEFKNFINKNMRLIPVDCTQDKNIEETLLFFMAENRKVNGRYAYIMDNLKITEESFHE
jgi:DNA gyrase/topoisomerase IV subunit B